MRAVLARPQSAIVDVMRHDWQRGVADALTKNGVAHLVADATGRQTLAHALLTLAVEPIDAGWLLLSRPLSGSNAERIGGPQCFIYGRLRDVTRLVTPRQRESLADVLATCFISELLVPSKPLWLISAWISDIDVIDNGAGAFESLVPLWPNGPVEFLRCLRACSPWAAKSL